MRKIVTVTMLFVAVLASSAFVMGAEAENERNASTKEKMLLVEAIALISSKYNVFFTFDHELVKDIEVEYDFSENRPVESVISGVLSGTELEFKLYDRRFVILYQNDERGLESLKEMVKHFEKVIADGVERRKKRTFLKPVNALALREAWTPPMRLHLNFEREVGGRVTDQEGVPLIGVNVQVKGTSKGTATDFDGDYGLEDVEPTAILVFSYIGYQTLEIPVDGRSKIDITLLSDAQMLDEVVVVGYGKMQRSSITGSVSRVDAGQIENSPNVNVMNSLQGLAPGVLINPARQPGESPSIRIRGNRSLSASNEPLVIIDGMPGSWDNLVSQDIESMEILKDAAATAIYGSRAANGVVLITTKSGAKSDRLNVEISSYAGVNSYDFIQMQSAEKYAELIRDVMRYQTHGVSNRELWQNSTIDTKTGMEMFHGSWAENYYEKGVNYDWQKELFNQNSFTQGHNISMSNRTEKLSYRLTYNYQEDNSYYKTVNFKKHVLNANADLKITDWWNVGVISRLSLRQNTGWPDNMWDNMRRMTPFETPYINEDPRNGYKDAVGKEGYVNAILNYEKGYLIDDRKGQMTDVIFKTEINPYEWLALTSNFKIDLYQRSRGIYRDSKTSFQNLGLNYASLEKNSNVNYTWNGIVNIDKTLHRDHKLMATGVIEAIKLGGETIGSSAQDIPAQYMGYHYLQTGIVNRDLWSAFTKSTLLSYMARGQYEYKRKYLFNAAMRADGSSRLASQNRWRVFPSVSAAWYLSEEEFMKNQNLLSSLKFRLSYGEVGNQAISPYQTLTTLSQKTYNWGESGIFTWQPSGIANANLGWEVSKTSNVGVDFGFNNVEVFGSVEYYHTTNSDLLMQQRLPGTTGFSSIWQNIGETVNQGIELSLSTHLISKKDFQWGVGTMISRNWNEITKLTGDKDDRSNQWFIGEPIGVVWDYKKEGIWQIDEAEEARKYNMQPGEIKIVDRNGDYAFSDDDKFILGQREPKLIASLQSSMKYKNWDFTFNLVGEFGHLITASNYTAEWNADKFIIDAIDWWTPLNPTNEWPRAHTAQGHKYSSTLNIFKGDFLKVQSFAIGYDLTKLLNKNKINRLRVYGQGTNPWYVYKATLSDINPEQPNTMYTIPATFIFGFNVNF